MGDDSEFVGVVGVVAAAAAINFCVTFMHICGHMKSLHPCLVIINGFEFHE